MTGEVSVETDERGVATLWLDRPAKRNSVTYEMWLGIAEACRALATDPAVRVLIVRGRGDHFCAGADIASLGDRPRAVYSAANEQADVALAEFPKPSIAYITGACVGGGAEIAIACDLRIADTTARFGITPARLGIVYPPFALERATRVLGASAVKHLLFSAELIDAARALRIGLIDELHEPAAAAERVAALTDLLVGPRSLLTQMASKEMVDEIVHRGAIAPETAARWADAVAHSPDFAEGVTAFGERRDPIFSWRPDA